MEEAREQTTWVQLTLEAVIFTGLAMLLFVAADRIPAARTDAEFALGIAVVLHAAGLVRWMQRAADHAASSALD